MSSGSKIITPRSGKPPVVEVLRRRGPRPVEPPSAPLPVAVTQALAAIVRDMRDVPRDCIRDPAELVIWLRRMEGRLEGVGRMRVAGGNCAKSQTDWNACLATCALRSGQEN